MKGLAGDLCARSSAVAARALGSRARADDTVK